MEKRKESGKYCDCHKDWGHVTDECYYLQDRLEELVRDGTLKFFVKGSAPSTNMVVRREKTINPIFAKIDSMSKNQRARWSEDKKNVLMAVNKEHGYNYWSGANVETWEDNGVCFTNEDKHGEKPRWVFCYDKLVSQRQIECYVRKVENTRF